MHPTRKAVNMAEEIVLQIVGRYTATMRYEGR